MNDSCRLEAVRNFLFGRARAKLSSSPGLSAVTECYRGKQHAEHTRHNPTYKQIALNNPELKLFAI